MKIAPLFHALNQTDWAVPVLVHTGQHYDVNMSDVFFRDLGLPEPDHHLGVGSGTHAEQMGRVMIEYERICSIDPPDWIIVVGDVNSTAAAALVGAKLWIPVVHLEAGLRSGDRRMPEEINRLVTDSISDVLWTPSEDADQNLLAEGVSPDKIDRIGNIMIDSFEMLKKNIEESAARSELGLDQGQYGLVTLHRPSNVDSAESLAPIVDQLLEASTEIAMVFVAHPAPGTPPVHQFHERGVGCEPGHYRFWGATGGDDLPGHSLPHIEREHRKTDHGDHGNESTDFSRRPGRKCSGSDIR